MLKALFREVGNFTIKCDYLHRVAQLTSFGPVYTLCSENNIFEKKM